MNENGRPADMPKDDSEGPNATKAAGRPSRMKTNLISTVVGRKGMGKSFLTRKIVAEAPRAIILDTLGEYDGRGMDVVWGRDRSIRAMAAAAKKRRYKLALRGLDEDEMLDALEMVYEIPDSLVVVEEASMVCRASFLPREMAQLVRYGRHREISQLYIARRPSELPRDLTAQSDLVITLQQKEPRDILYLRATGFDEGELIALSRLPDDKARGYILVHGDLAAAPLPVLEQLARQKPLPGTSGKLDLTGAEDDATDQAAEPEPGEEAAPEAV